LSSGVIICCFMTIMCIWYALSHLIIFLKWLLTSYVPIWLLAHYSLCGWIIGWQLLKRSLKTKRMSNWHATFTVDLHLVYIINKSIITYACDISIYVQSNFCTMWQTILIVLFKFSWYSTSSFMLFHGFIMW